MKSDSVSSVCDLKTHARNQEAKMYVDPIAHWVTTLEELEIILGKVGTTIFLTDPTGTVYLQCDKYLYPVSMSIWSQNGSSVKEEWAKYSPTRN